MHVQIDRTIVESVNGSVINNLVCLATVCCVCQTTATDSKRERTRARYKTFLPTILVARIEQLVRCVRVFVYRNNTF